MKQLHVRVGRLLCLVVGLLGLLTPAFGQAKKENVHQLAIYNGELRTVHYFTKGLSENEKADVRDLQEAQNDLAFASYKKALAQQPIGPGYVRPIGWGYGWPGYGGYPFYFGDIVPTYFSNLNYILSDSAPLYGAYMPYYGFGYGAYAAPAVGFGAGFGCYGGYGGYGASRPIVGSAYLDRGNSDVPVSKTLSEDLASATKHLDRAMARIMDSPTLVKAFDLPKDKPNGRDRSHPLVTVTMKNGKPIKGRLVEEDKDIIIVDTGDEEVEIRKNDTVSIGRAKPKGDKKK